ncbi:MAG: helix-turn-helix transcriptional regulator [Bacteroidota bacterium]
MFDTQEFKKDLNTKRVFENKLSMGEAAKQIGISKATYSRLERGSRPAVDTLAKCSVWMNIPICEILKTIETLDIQKFKKDLITKRTFENNLSMDEAAKQIGISRSAYRRLEFGEIPVVDTLSKCGIWLNMPIYKILKIIEILDTQEFKKKLIIKRVFENKLSMDEAAKQTGISETTYRRLERGIIPPFDALSKCSDWLNKPICKVFRIIKTIDTHEFQKKLVTKRTLENNLTINEAAKQIGISKSTYIFLEQGGIPDMDTLAKCIIWLNVPDVKYFQKVKKNNDSIINHQETSTGS